MRQPRLTVALRAFSEYAAPPTEERQSIEQVLQVKRLSEARRLARENNIPWDEFSFLATESVIFANRSLVEDALKELKNVTRDLVGKEASWDVAAASAVYLFGTFYNTEMVTYHQMQEMHTVFGEVNPGLVNHVCAAVQRLAVLLPEDCIQNVLLKRRDCDLMEEEFGRGIKYVPVKLENMIELSDNEMQEKMAFYSQNSTTVEQNMKKFNESYQKPKVENSTSSAKRSDKLGLDWMKNQMKEYFPDSSIHDLTMSTYHLLCTSKSNEELQNELFELLGFDRFELIGKFLEQRNELVASKTTQPTCESISSTSSSKLEQRPNYGCQVVIQSEMEKLIQKHARKDDKKLLRLASKLTSATDDFEEDKFSFDVQLMRLQREEDLTTAALKPILQQKTTPSAPREHYPNVYDSYLEAKQTAGYIAGLKMSLPAGFERFNTKQYEEVVIPPSDPAPVHVGKKLKPISELDEIGQIAFKGTKSLNRIQSVVFDTAYHTNENLLICAPTGAGKTNIAMLAIIHEMKQHIELGVLRKERFKIVYVAPMKALAAEMVRNFSKRLEPLGVLVRELTGDMQLTKSEIVQTQIIVTTPEKWDVVTRKGMGDVALTQLVRLLIIDEVHLLHGDRGPVVEALVARTLRQVESSQSMIRIVGLSATLPNYLDVGAFLNVNPAIGLFFFDSRFRPVPLGQTFIGVKATNPLQQMQDMDAVCYEKVSLMVDQGHQVMVFVHARNATVRTALTLRELAKNKNHLHIFEPAQNPEYGQALKQIMASRNKQLREMFPSGFAIHHAGMLRHDRNLVEKFFADGLIKVLVCTATLAWGVNLPAHAVVIKGTEIYDAQHGAFVDLGILDVLQIFGRAGRPQFDKSGHGTIITSHAKLSHYLSLLTCQYPIESNFIKYLADNLNAEVSLGTVANIKEAVQWLSYTYLFVRMRANPLAYGINYNTAKDDIYLNGYRTELIVAAAKNLDNANMIRFDAKSENLHATDLGRTASNYYIKYDTVGTINEYLRAGINEATVLEMVSRAEEFNQLKVRDDEMDELDRQIEENCMLPVNGGKENTHGKVNILIQTHISRGSCEAFSLVSDKSYVVQNSTRIVRALFEIVLRKNWSLMAGRLLRLSKVLERQLWEFENPLHQFSCLSAELVRKLEDKNLTLDRLKEMDASEIGHFIHHQKMGPIIKRCAESLPAVILEATIQPITRTILRIRLNITPDFRWDDKVHGNGSESFWIWVEDPESDRMHHYEYFLLTKKQVQRKEMQTLMFTIPVADSDALPSQYYVRAVSDRWLGSDSTVALSFQHLILPDRHPPHTELLDLQPLPISVLGDPQLEALYKFSHFNPVQTQIFHTLYHSDGNVLLGAPTGSGKTIAAEVAMFRVFREYPGTKVVYIAPMKALVRERMEDWKLRLVQKLGKTVVELTGDVMPDARAIAAADVIVTTPEKWDGVSRSWQTRNYVKSVSLIVIDEIHLLGEDRGPVLEVIVSRTNFITSHTEFPLRVIGLSTALANARDLADWLGIKEVGLFNFRPSVRPVPLEVHIEGFPGKHYCPRMATMNKPSYNAIKMHSPTKPTLIFVSSRRQTRLTALDLIAYLAAEDNPKQWVHKDMVHGEIENVISGIKDVNLKLTLAFGIGIHHAGLQERDRKTVEELFVNQKIQVLVATATLAWGVNFPAHLVVVKGTEYYDGKTRRYVDFPITDVLQMMGRAGRPQYDDHGVAVVLVQDVKKNFYKKFLYEPFPVESSLLEVLPEHLNAEIVAGTITSKQDCMDYITWTYFFRRLLQNPSYYHLEELEHSCVNRFLSGLVEKSLNTLTKSFCVEIGEDGREVLSTTLGRIASYYYLHYSSVRLFREKMMPDLTVEQLLEIMCSVHEYEELPVRHNEDSLNSDLAKTCPVEVNPYTYDSPHTKANLLLQAHFSRLQMPCSDYLTDLKSVLDQAIRILQAMLDVAADEGWLVTALRVANMIQMVLQACWYKDSSLLILPHIEPHQLYCFKKNIGRSASRQIECLPQLMAVCGKNYENLASMVREELDENQIQQVFEVLNMLPAVEVRLCLKGWWQAGLQQEERSVPNGKRGGIRPESDWIQVHSDQEYILNISLNRLYKSGKRDSKAIAPRFPKPKDEGWFLILGDIETKELLALKRIGYLKHKSSCQLMFYSPETTGRVIYTLYLMSDCYVGLDQQYDICLDVIPCSIEAQANSEIQIEDAHSEPMSAMK